MDPRLLRHYEGELHYLREMGAEFAEEFPKIAARLGMSGLEVADPYVERLLEGVAFLAARVQLKLDAEVPRFTQALLEIIYPHYLAPTPAMLVAQLTPDPKEPQLGAGNKVVPRGTGLLSLPTGERGTSCEFKTAHDVELWPVRISSVSYFTFAPDLPLQALPYASRIRGGIRVRLSTTAGVKFSQMPLDRLTFYATGREDVAAKLCDLCLSTPLGVLVTDGGSGSAIVPDSRARGVQPVGVLEPAATRVRAELPGTVVRPIGFSDDEALLPVSLRSFQGYRLLQEYFSLPERFRFFQLNGLAAGLKSIGSTEAEVVILFGRGEPALEGLLAASNLALYCTPAINLFPKRADRVAVSDATHEMHVVVDRTRPVDFEVYELTRVVGYGTGFGNEQEFAPFYAAFSPHHTDDRLAYYTMRREPRLLPSARKRRGPRTSYIGSELFISLVDPRQAPFAGDLRQIAVDALCTNRDLPLLMPQGAKDAEGRDCDLSLDIAAPVAGIRVITGPSRPYGPLADGARAWRALNHLSLNYYSLVDATPEQGATTLRELLRLYAAGAEPGLRRQVDGIRSVRVKRVVRRLRQPGPIAFGRGLEITVAVDDLALEGASPVLLGAVLNEYFARHVSINAFSETVLTSEGRGEIHRWVPQPGARPTL
jgi:type VI secretion system protein ImpG